MEDYKEKYEQAIENIKKIKDANKDNKELVDFIEYKYPELKESEDEKIRKEIIALFQGKIAFPSTETIKKYTVWLEKQGKKIDAIENFDTEFEKQVSHLVASTINKEYEYTSDFVKWTANVLLNYAKHELEKQGEQKIEPAPIFKIGDILKRKGKDYTFRVDRIQGGYYHCDRNHGAFFPMEEQGNWELVEQNPADKVEPKLDIEKGKWYVCNTPRYKDFVVGKAYYCPKNGMLKPNENEMARYVASYCFHLWTIQDAKDGDVIAFDNSTIVIFKDLYNATTFHSYCYIEGGVFNISKNDWWNGKGFYPATKEQKDFLFSKMKEAGYEWDSEKKELKKIKQEQTELPNGEDYGIDSLYHAARILEKTLGDVEGYQSDDGILEHKCAIEAVNRLYKQKPAWSEEDKNMLQNILECLKNGWSKLPTDILKYESWLKSLKERVQSQSKQEWSEEEKARIDKIIDVLDWAEKKGHIRYSDWEDYVCYVKSLKPQNTWKPSDGQMATFWDAICNLNQDGYKWINDMKSLYYDLKKLRKE